MDHITLFLHTLVNTYNWLPPNFVCDDHIYKFSGNSVWALSNVYVLRYKHLQNFVRSNKKMNAVLMFYQNQKHPPFLWPKTTKWTKSQIRRFDLVAILVHAFIPLQVRYDIYYTKRSEWGKNNVMSVELLSTGLAFCVP